ncbi:beta-propeller domain-containing protein [Nocardioides sp. W7]|uniref:beta-propeller domain-containing protein n=1 Tax=Nocardioides sp. W7 TaxID=2931390 RepID=UPI001FD41271|nr:beta-propeller domain-containing protein [Nocardioides sp. W7]
MLRFRPLLVLGATAALAAAFLAGTVVTGSDAPTGQTLAAGADPVPVAAPGAPVGFADDCDTLLDAYVGRALELVGPWGWNQGYDGALFRSLTGNLAADMATPLPASAQSMRSAAKAPASQRATSEESGTNVQESGVDEPDVVKTDGELLVRLDDGVLTTYDVSGGSAPAELGRLVLSRARQGELLLSGDTATVVAAQDDGSTRVLTVDLADPAGPALTATSEYDARLVAARLHGSVVRVVVASGLPGLPFVQPRRSRTDRQAARANRRLVRETTIEDWLPTIADDAEPVRPLLDCSAVALPEEAAGLDTLAVVGFEADEPTERSVQGLAAAADVAYFSADHLYLATGHGTGWEDCCFIGRGPRQTSVSGLGGSTTIHDLALDGTSTTYLASGRVDGQVADRWAMDEQGGVLRLAVGPTQLTGNFNSVLTLEQDGPRLVEVGRLDKLGVDEQIRSVRWFDGLAIVVTFRQVDPLYAVDLTAAAPTLLGELKIPGFSEYLHPLGKNRMIGIGQGPTGTGRGWGAQVGFFNVTDLADVQRLDVLSYGRNTQALAGMDPRQLTWLPERRTVLTVVEDYGRAGRTGYVSVLHLHHRQISNRMVEVEHGSDVDEVRTVPLGDGRVVLVTGSEVSYFAV